MTRGEAEAGRQLATEATLAAVSGLDGVTIVDPFDRLCDVTTCQATEDGVVLMSDESHLSSAGAKLLTGQLRAALVEVGAG